MKICYELGGERAGKEGNGPREKASVIPDGWILFEKMKKGTREASFPVVLEIDRGTMFRERFKKHVTDRIEFVRSGAYERMFGTKAVVIAYVTTGATGEEKEGRRKALCAWTTEALRGAKRESWASVFRFASVSFGKIYESGLFEGACWYRPDHTEPARLFT